METFIEQKAKVRQQILELENENRRLQRQADDAEMAIDDNLKRIAELYQTLSPVVSPVEFESNPIVRVYPATGKHYPMRVVRRSVASFKLTFQRACRRKHERD